MNTLSLSIFFQLLKRDLAAFRHEYFSKLMDTFAVFLVNVVVFAYFMPLEGLSKNYGSFFAVGAIASYGLIEIVGKVAVFIADLDGNRAITQILIMPIRSPLIFAYIAIFWALTSGLLAIFLFPFAKLILFNKFGLEEVSYFKFIIMFITANMFFGFFALWLSSVTKGLDAINGLWARYINPMWMFGAFFYSWHSVYALNPVIAYVSLINPMVYVMEGMRAAVLGQEGYLPFWMCLAALWGFIVVCFTIAVPRLKKRLDCV